MRSSCSVRIVHGKNSAKTNVDFSFLETMQDAKGKRGSKRIYVYLLYTTHQTYQDIKPRHLPVRRVSCRPIVQSEAKKQEGRYKINGKRRSQEG